MLALTSVTANVRITTSTGLQLGFGGRDNYAGNLVPFSAGTVYEENPTITYSPAIGVEYAGRVLSPVPVSVLAQMSGTLADPAYVYEALGSSVNGIPNPEFQLSPADPDPRFGRFVTLMTRLTQANRLHWIEDPQRTHSFSIVIDKYAPAYTAEVRDLLEVLGLRASMDRSAQLVLPVFLALDDSNSEGLAIITRSVGDLIEMLSAAIDVPGEDLQRGVAATYPPLGLAGRGLRIRRSNTKPERAAVAVQYREAWFYFDESDGATKRFFRLMNALWSVAVAESAAGAPAAPALTVPLSR